MYTIRLIRECVKKKEDPQRQIKILIVTFIDNIHIYIMFVASGI